MESKNPSPALPADAGSGSLSPWRGLSFLSASRLGRPPSPKEGGPLPAPSPAGAGRAFARRRVVDAQDGQPATARRRVRGRLHGNPSTDLQLAP
jgi:hypothetical protein